MRAWVPAEEGEAGEQTEKVTKGNRFVVAPTENELHRGGAGGRKIRKSA